MDLRLLAVAVGLLASLAGAPAGAQEREYRALKLADGRAIAGEVIESNAEGMLMRVPQGTILVPYSQLKEVGIEDEAGSRSGLLIVAVAPSTAPMPLIRQAAELDSWLHEAVTALPATAAISPSIWTERLGPAGYELLSCRGDEGCLRPKAKALGGTVVLIPTLVEGPALRLDAIVVSTGAAIGTGTAPLAGSRRELAPHLIRATLAALGFTPEGDLTALAELIEDGPPLAGLPTAPIVATVEPGPAVVVVVEPEPAVAAVEAEPEPAVVVVVEPEPTVEPIPAVEPEPTVEPIPPGGRLTVISRTPRQPAVQGPRLGAVIGLGFAPVPGLSSAYLEDGPGFVVALVGSLAAGALAVYTLGATLEHEGPFVASSVLTPYAISVAFNQVTGLIGWSRLRTSARVARVAPPPSAVIAPLLARTARGSAAGAAFALVGEF